MDSINKTACNAIRAALTALALCGCAVERPADRPALEPVGEFQLPQDAPEGLSGIAWLGDDRYALAEDSGGRVHFARIGIDPSTGAVTSCVFEKTIAVPGLVDAEGIACDPAGGAVYVSDETGPAIFRIPEDGATARIAVPDFFFGARPNKSLEALSAETTANGGCILWTANEDALGCDGAMSSAEDAAVVRIAAFAPGAAGECRWWRYELDRAEGKPIPAVGARTPFNGVAGLLALGGGRLLVLERMCGLRDPENGEGPHTLITCGIFLVDTSRAPAESLLAKKSLWRARFPASNYEGMTLGPPLDDGTRTVILVADGDVSTATVLGRTVSFQWQKALYSFRLRDAAGAKKTTCQAR